MKTQAFKSMLLSMLVTVGLASLALIASGFVSEDAYAGRGGGGARGGGGGARGGGGAARSAPRPSSSASSSVRQGSANRNYAGSANRNAGVNQNINRSGNVNQNINRNGNVNSNINRNANINRDVNVDIDHDYHNDWDGGEFFAGMVVGGVTGAIIADAYTPDVIVAAPSTMITTLPAGCVTVYINGVST
jgi:hypothetical protein